MLKRFVARSFVPGLLALVLAPLAASQTVRGPQPTLIRDVVLDAHEDAEVVHLLLRDGAIEAVLKADSETPPGVRVIEGKGMLCLPAFLDAYSNTGCKTPQPEKDQDVPLDVRSDVRVDMRGANRKGVQPAFRAVHALSVEKSASDGWREAGFGAALVAPGGELLAGTSTLIATREAAARDVVIDADVAAHAAFNASGDGYPSTLMGFIAQLRQFFHDAARHSELHRRYEQGRPGVRPPHDEDLEAGAALLEKKRLLFCEADTSRDVERWLKLADEFGLKVAFTGGRDAWRVSDELARRDVPVVLTLDWGKEVKDPLAKDKKKKGKGEKKEQAEEPAPEEAEEPSEPEEGDPQAEAADSEEAAGEAAAEEDEPEVPEIVFEYSEPLGARQERRRKWVERRDTALRLTEAGVRYAFGTKEGKPKKLLGDVRTLVKEGLARDAALSALTTTPARLFGVDDRLGRVDEGFDATFCLWTKDPLADEKAQLAWIFVDGYPTEYEVKEEKPDEPREAPAEGVDLSGVWEVAFEERSRGAFRSAVLKLTMADDGELTGTITVENRREETEVEADVAGHVSGKKVKVTSTVSFGEFEVEAELTGEMEGEAWTGEGSFTTPFRNEPSTATFTATRQPE